MNDIWFSGLASLKFVRLVCKDKCVPDTLNVLRALALLHDRENLLGAIQNLLSDNVTALAFRLNGVHLQLFVLPNYQLQNTNIQLSAK